MTRRRRARAFCATVTQEPVATNVFEARAPYPLAAAGSPDRRKVVAVSCEMTNTVPPMVMPGRILPVVLAGVIVRTKGATPVADAPAVAVAKPTVEP